MTSKETADKSAAAPKLTLLESEIWSPTKVGEKVAGRLGVPEMGPFGEQQVIIGIPPMADITLPCLVVLKKLNRVPLGTFVSITYEGEVLGKTSGKTYKNFTIEADLTEAA